ncbi:MAG: DUF3524 domain-containing protein [Planctomycetota bacterium]|nr:DUF3524 domain-containing protein [Planctomycetota bacterium]
MTRAALRLLYVEPFDAGSHAGFGTMLGRHAGFDLVAWRMPGRHWKWRMRGAALWFAEREPDPGPVDAVFASSYTPLADLCALRPDIARVPRVLYFHENQWAYPDRTRQERDNHLAFTQVVSAAAADLCLFNSQHNRDTFLRATRDFVARMPDARPTATVDALARRCEVLPIPVAAPSRAAADAPLDGTLLILWNHRWEHDKRPEAFFAALAALAEQRVSFRVAVCGQAFGEAPPVFAAARDQLGERVFHWGPIEDRERYEDLLSRCDVVVSTAAHEFFGVSILEAALAGCRPLVPDRLAYPETIPARFRYRDDRDLTSRLRAWSEERAAGHAIRLGERPEFARRFLPSRVLPTLEGRLRDLIDGRPPHSRSVAGYAPLDGTPR